MRSFGNKINAFSESRSTGHSPQVKFFLDNAAAIYVFNSLHILGSGKDPAMRVDAEL